MGLIKAASGAASGVLADQWKEYFYCDALDQDTLVVKGKKKSSGRSSNKKGEDNVITNGSAIVVSDGQCAMIVEQGQVLEICAEPGVFTYNSEISPSVFVGDLKEGLKGAAREAFDRFKFGGAAGKDQRIYYFNTKEIMGNKYGTATPVAYHISDSSIGFELDTKLKCNGEYSYRIVNPMLFYTNVCGNISDYYRRDEIDTQMKSELLTALAPAFGQLSAKGTKYHELALHTVEIADSLNEIMTKKWAQLRGVQVVSFGINGVTIPDEDLARLQNYQESVPLQNTRAAAAAVAAASADAMRAAARNEGGVQGFMGMGMAAGAANNAAGLFAAAGAEEASAPRSAQTKNAAPANPDAWTCSCGATVTGRFCSECGSPKPASAKLYKCDKCGWEPEDPSKPPKFCPECGDVFDENDVQ